MLGWTPQYKKEETERSLQNALQKQNLAILARQWTTHYIWTTHNIREKKQKSILQNAFQTQNRAILAGQHTILQNSCKKNLQPWLDTTI